MAFHVGGSGGSWNPSGTFKEHVAPAGNNFSAFGFGGKSGALGKNDFLGKTFDNANPWLQSSLKAAQAKKDKEQAANELYEKTGALNKTLNEADTSYGESYKKSGDDYLNAAGGLVNDYTSKINDLQSQSQQQANDAKTTYTNSILPEYKNAMSQAKNNAAGAMTLQQASDPNNPIMKAVRDLYNQQGQQARQQGQQDFGVLSALGAQAAGQQFGAAGPMTAGQMGQIYAANQGQAGDAYARAQQRMYDLQNQGLNKSFDQSNQLYQFGQQAQGRYSDTIKDLQNGENSYYDQQNKFRGEQGGYAGDILGVQQGLNTDKYNVGTNQADITKGNAYAGTGREQQSLNQLYGAKQNNINSDLQANMANNASKAQFISSLVGAAAGASDKRMKKNINDVSNADIDEFLKAVKPKAFDYKDTSEPGTSEGRRIGFMMQDVQGTKLGDAMTRKSPDGKLMYDKDNLNGVLLAALSRDAKKRAA